MATFDTLKMMDHLRKTFPDEQARAITEAWAEAVTEELVTKEFLRAELAQFENRFMERMTGLEGRLSRRIYAAFGALTVLITIFEFIR